MSPISNSMKVLEQEEEEEQQQPQPLPVWVDDKNRLIQAMVEARVREALRGVEAPPQVPSRGRGRGGGRPRRRSGPLKAYRHCEHFEKL
ncbi:hypothetical protein GE061_000183 [Apolygus lucorum]|uniref:Uncharacterized protein n=1 Tax=Apolygus lucorum TaxID=248454 RepID=A0A8S9Y5K9_APOLU|nr:hypothetical protein GE061_000183 [Apolygus lucorum]